MSTTERLALPLIASGQAQKEMTHNEALAALDIAVQPVVEAVGLDMPPALPIPGQCWIVGAAPAGVWAGHAHALAGWTMSGWRFLMPRTGWTAWDRGSGLTVRYDGSNWISGIVSAARIDVEGVQVITTRQDAIASPAGGAVIDAEGRVTLISILNILRAHGLIAT